MRILQPLLIATIVLFNSVICLGQKTVKPEKFQTWINLGHLASNEGYLRSVSKDTVIISNSLLQSTETGFKTYPVVDIRQVQLRKKSSQGLGILIGLAAGATAGALIGKQIEGGDFCGGKCGGTEPGTLIALGAIGGALVGAGVGVAIGSRKKKIKLNGRMTEEQHEKLKMYVIPPSFSGS